MTKLQSKRPAADHIRNGLERSRFVKLERCAEGIACRQSQ